MKILGIDVGGTFVDFVMFDSVEQQSIYTHYAQNTYGVVFSHVDESGLIRKAKFDVGKTEALRRQKSAA